MEEWSALGSGHLTPYKETQYPWIRVCVCSRDGLEILDKKKVSFLCRQPIVGLSKSWSSRYKAYIVAKPPVNTLLTPQ